MIGASGAISGVLGAYILLHPGATVRVLIFLGFFVTVAHVPALIVLGIWFLLQLFSGFATPTEGGGVAFWAHIGGFVGGFVLDQVLQAAAGPYSRKAAPPPFEIERRRGPWG